MSDQRTKARLAVSEFQSASRTKFEAERDFTRARYDKEQPLQNRGSMCTCNERQKHIVATRRTADDVVIKLWSTGEITTIFGATPKSVGKSPWANRRAQAVRVNWLVDFALYDWRELSVVITAYRNELRKVGLLYSESDAVITAKRQLVGMLAKC